MWPTQRGYRCSCHLISNCVYALCINRESKPYESIMNYNLNIITNAIRQSKLYHEQLFTSHEVFHASINGSKCARKMRNFLALLWHPCWGLGQNNGEILQSVSERFLQILTWCFTVCTHVDGTLWCIFPGCLIFGIFMVKIKR